jgi:hypothetical protein
MLESQHGQHYKTKMIKCVVCGKYIDPNEVVWVRIDDSHEAAYCVVCSPDDSMYSEDDYEDY